MKEDHSFERVENKTEVLDIIDTPIPEETVVEIKEEQKEEIKEKKVEEKKEKPKKVIDPNKKPINIGLIFLGVFVGVILFVYIFLGTPTVNFMSSSEDGDSFYITFSKLEDLRQSKEKEELDNKKATLYSFETGTYINDVGVYLIKNGESLMVYYTGDGKTYTLDIKNTERDYYEDDLGETIPFINEYVEFTDSNSNKVRVEKYFDDVKYVVGDRTYFLKKNEKPYSFEGLYRDGNKYILLFSCYDITSRLSNVEGIYFDGTKYGVLNLDNIVDMDGDKEFEEEVTKNNSTTLTGKLNSKDIFKLSINNNGSTYSIKFDYTIYNNNTGKYENTGTVYESLEGNYVK